jgi:hypothetical protein
MITYDPWYIEQNIERSPLLSMIISLSVVNCIEWKSNVHDPTYWYPECIKYLTQKKNKLNTYYKS